jgi:PAS domain S-box-containing protein
MSAESMPPETHQPSEQQPYRWLPGIITLLAVIALGVGAVALRYVENRLVAVTGQQLELAAVEVADKVDRLMVERYSDILMLARALGPHVSNLNYLDEHLIWTKEAHAPVYLWLAVADPKGRIAASTKPSLVGQARGDAAWFQTAKNHRTVSVADVALHDREDGIETIAHSAPILSPKGEVLGVVTSRISIRMIEEIVTGTIQALERRKGFYGAAEYQMLAQDGRVIVDSDRGRANPEDTRPRHGSVADHRLAERPGYVEEIHEDRQVPVVTGYARTKGAGELGSPRWTVLVRVDRDQILQPIHRALWRIGLVGALVWIPLLVFLFWVTRRLRTQYLQAQRESEWARAAEAALLQSRERIRAIVDTAMDGVVTMDAEGIITEWNAQASHIFGWNREEVLGRSLADTVIPARDRSAHLRGLQEFLQTGHGPILNRRIEIMALHRNGYEFPVEIAVSPVRVGEAYFFSAFVRDITDRRRSEARLAAQYAVSHMLAQSRSLEEALPKVLQAIGTNLDWDLGIFWRVDRQANVLRCLTVWQAASVKADEFIEVTWRQTFASGEGLPGRVWAGGEALWTRDVVGDATFLRADAAAKAELPSAFGFAVRVGGEVEGVIELYSSRPQEPDEELLKMAADMGLKIGQFAERARAEEALQQTEAQLRQSQKMEAVGRLAGGVAHDFNNLLTVIRGYSELMLYRLGEHEPLRKEIEEVKKAADRAASLTGQLLAFSRRQFVAPKVVDLNAVVHNMEGMLRRLIGEDVIELSTVLDPNVGQIRADPSQIEQVIMNLAVNARDAMPSGGTLTIETGRVEVHRRIPGRVGPVEPGSYVLLLVRDTGHGMDEETQSHLFEPFFTTKEKGKGTGLGLSTVYGIVRQSGGSIIVESKPGRGSTFKIYFPHLVEVAGAIEGASGGPEHVRGKETVLVVEDEPGVRTLVHETLKLHGYHVLEARHGIEALLTGARHPGPIHLLLTDVVMPQMSGPEVAEKLSPARPEMRVLYMSGYPDHPVFAQSRVKTDTAFLQKPFTPNTLVRKVREVLDAVPKVA